MDAEKRFSCNGPLPRKPAQAPWHGHPLSRYARVMLMAVLAVLLMGLGGSLPPPPASDAPPNTFSKRYIMILANLNRADVLTRVLSIMDRGAAAGYNGIVLGHSSGEYIVLESASPTYLQNFARVRERAQHLGLKLIPLSCYPQQVSYKDPSLAEGLPCRNTPFLVQGNVATVNPSREELLVNPDFESAVGDIPTPWVVDKPGIIIFADRQVTRSGGSSLRIQNPSLGDPVHGHARIVQQVQVTPFRAYALSFWLKTEGLADPGMMKAYVAGIDGSNTILYQNRYLGMGAPVAATQGWTRYIIHFNSVSNTRVAVYLGAWARNKDSGLGKAWIDGVTLREVGLTHMVRRTSLPVTVTSANGLAEYREGVDFLVEEGQLRLPAGSAIPDGAQLRVSWYLFADMLEMMPPASGCSDRYYEIQEDISRRLNTLFGSPSGFMMNYDEWRVANWDPSWGNISAGEYVARVTRRSVEMLKTINPQYELYVWSDMYDPHENAVAQYYLVNGNLTGSWEGLPKDVIVMTWAGGTNALAFFAANGYQQMIAGYYDAFDNLATSMAELEAAEAGGARGIIGFMYTTWEHNYDDLERVAAFLRAKGRWGDGGPARTPTMPGGDGPKHVYATE